MNRIIQFIGESGAGKTRLIENLIDYAQKSELSVGVIKSASHINLDTKGKDTMRFMDAGSHKIAITSHEQSAFFSNNKVGLIETVLGFFMIAE